MFLLTSKKSIVQCPNLAGIYASYLFHGRYSKGDRTKQLRLFEKLISESIWHAFGAKAGGVR